MYIKIDEVVYSTVKGLTFSPETDLTGTAMPVNELKCDVYTEDDIAIGQYAELYDDLDGLWAKYWIMSSERLDRRAVRIRAQSDVAMLERVRLDPVMYNATPVTEALEDVLVYSAGAPGIVAPMPYAIDGSLIQHTLTGYCPEQTARERFMWVCFVIGAYVQTAFTDRITILPIQEAAKLVPLADTFLKPTVTKKDIVTAVGVKYFSFAAGTPQTTDKWVQDGAGNTYIQTETVLTLTNTDAPAGTPENIVRVENVTLINADNAAEVLTQMARWYFATEEVQLDAIDNADYYPGDLLTVYTGEDAIRQGHCTSTAFSFGAQARARMKLTATVATDAALLTILYQHGDLTLNTVAMYLPLGYAYSIPNPYIDQMYNGHRIIYRPEAEAAEGVMNAATVEDTEAYEPALDLYQGVLEIISVDELSVEDGVVEIK